VARYPNNSSKQEDDCNRNHCGAEYPVGLSYGTDRIPSHNFWRPQSSLCSFPATGSPLLAIKNRREHGTTPGEFGYETSTPKASESKPEHRPPNAKGRQFISAREIQNAVEVS
jgi:hypothetical protein